MTALRKSEFQPRTSHRTYRDPDATEVAICRQVNTSDELIRLAAGVDGAEIRQAPGSGWIPQAMTATVIQALRSIDLVGGSADPRAERLERKMRRRLGDAPIGRSIQSVSQGSGSGDGYELDRSPNRS
jgi:hypothetical protein